MTRLVGKGGGLNVIFKGWGDTDVSGIERLWPRAVETRDAVWDASSPYLWRWTQSISRLALEVVLPHENWGFW